jgi:mitochondrial fission protein ELM1
LSSEFNGQIKKPLIEENIPFDAIVINNHEKVKKKSSSELKDTNSGKELTRQLSKPQENGNNDDGMSVISHQNSFHDELTATLRSRKQTVVPINSFFG